MVLASSIALILSMVFAGAVTDVDQEERTISDLGGHEGPLPMDQSPFTVDLDCDPDTMNLKSKGKWVTCYVEFEPIIESFYIIEQAGLSEIVVPVPSPEDAPSFYDYSSASSHTGFEEPYKSKFMLHKDTSTEETSLIIHHNIDRDGTGIITGFGRVDFDLEGVPPSGHIPLVDDPMHVWDPPRTKEFSLSYPGLEGHWAYGDNTDGGVLSGLPNDEGWSITIIPLYWETIFDWEFVSGDGAVYTLDMSLPATITHVVVSTTVEDIDASTVLFNDVLPPVLDVKYGFVIDPNEYIVDHDNDSIPERKFKVDRTDWFEYFTPLPFEPIWVTGDTHDGRSFKGTEVVRTVHGG